jgi:hypothetical protein
VTTPLAGLGDRWLGHEPIDSVAFGPHARVRVRGGVHDGRSGMVRLLLRVSPTPVYLVALDGGVTAKLPQDALLPD